MPQLSATELQDFSDTVDEVAGKHWPPARTSPAYPAGARSSTTCACRSCR